MIARFHAMWITTLVVSVELLSGAEPSGRISDDDAQAFKWFSSVSGASSKNFQPVEIWSGATSQGGYGTLKAKSVTESGFLIRQDGTRFSIMSLWLNRREFTANGEPDDPGCVRFESRTMDELIAPYRAIGAPASDMLNKQNYGFFDLNWMSNPPDSQALTNFIIAWHCWNQNRSDLASSFLDRVKGQVGRTDGYTGKETGSVRHRLNADAAKFLFVRILASFGDSKLTWADLSLQLRTFMQNFPKEPDALLARQLADGIDSLILEEKARPLLSDLDFAKLPPADQAVEIVRRFRNQGLPQDRPEDNFFGESLKRGEAIIPALIAAVDDHRPTRDMSPRAGLKSIGDLAVDAIKQISSRRFEHNDRSSVFSPSPGESSARKTEIQNWWAEYQNKGAKQFLTEAVAKGDANSDLAARRLLAEFPTDAGPVIVERYRNLKTPTDKFNFLGGMYQAKTPECISLLQTEMKLGANLSIKEAAARCLQAMGREESTTAMLNEWRQIQAYSDPPGVTAVVRFLANSQNVDAIRELTGNLCERSRTIKMAAIDELAGAYDKAFWNRSAETPPEIQRMIEASLTSLLSDDQELWGLSGVCYRDPTIGDQAAWRLSQILPGRYAFDRSATMEKREAARLDCLNIWRQANGLDLVRPPELLELKAGARNQITEVRFADQGLEGSEIQAALKNLNGKMLSSDDLVLIICEFGRQMPVGINGIRVRAVRISKPTGVRVTVWSNKGTHPEIWQNFRWYGGVSSSNGTEFSQSGTRSHQNMVNSSEWKDWKDALDHALKEPDDSELLVRIAVGAMIDF